MSNSEEIQDHGEWAKELARQHVRNLRERDEDQKAAVARTVDLLYDLQFVVTGVAQEGADPETHNALHITARRCLEEATKQNAEATGRAENAQRQGDPAPGEKAPRARSRTKSREEMLARQTYTRRIWVRLQSAASVTELLSARMKDPGGSDPEQGPGLARAAEEVLDPAARVLREQGENARSEMNQADRAAKAAANRDRRRRKTGAG